MTYHVALIQHEYLGGYRALEWTLVDESGNHYRRNGVTLRFSTRDAAEDYADNLNDEFLSQFYVEPESDDHSNFGTM